MSNYTTDRQFTDYVHTHLAIPLIYKQLGWTEITMDKDELRSLDIHHGIDYVAYTFENIKIGIQERFRESQYARYNDFTLRYRRDYNADANRQRSEYFKVKAKYMIYGICNGSKSIEEQHKLNDFIKFAVIDLALLFQLIDAGKIQLQTGIHVSKIELGNMIAPIKENHDKSSSFVAFDILQLHQFNEAIILLQKGFF